MADLAAETHTSPTSAPAQSGWSPRAVAMVLVPLLLLAGVLVAILSTNAGLGDRTTPPIETLSVQRVRLPEPGMIEVSVTNDGPDEIAIVQVAVDDAYWQFSQSPPHALGRLESATIRIPYPWVQDEAHAISLISSTGVVFDAAVPVAVESPHTDRTSVLRLGLIGLYVGVIPVALGLLWYPSLRRLGRRGMEFVLALTIGLLLFLVIDMFQEGQELALDAPGSLNAAILLPVLAVLTVGLLMVAGQSLQRDRKELGGLPLAYQIAIGIGLHNLGEGLAIGAAFALGEAALGVFLIAGFTLHNVTEGIGIAAPVVGHTARVRHFAALAAIAGGPAIAGTWIGAFLFSPFWTVVFLAVGVGAIAQVIIEVGRLLLRGHERAGEPALTWTTLSGVAAGIVVMYTTALLVAA